MTRSKSVRDVAGRHPVLITSAWTPAVGGAATFADRLVSDERFVQRFRAIRHQNVKRPSMFFVEDQRSAARRSSAFRKIFSAAGNLWRFSRVLRREQPELVQMHYNGPFRGPLLIEACAYLRLARRAGVPTLVRHGGIVHPFEHERGSGWGRWTDRFYARAVDAFILQSDVWTPHYERWRARSGLDVGLVIVPNVVDTDRYTPADSERDAPHKEDRPLRFGCIAGPEGRRKGAYHLIDAVGLMRAPPGARREFEIDAAAVEPEFWRAVDRAGLNGSFKMRGFLRGPEKVDWLRSLDVFLLPSLAEGFPNILLEAMACGLPVVTTPVGATSGVVEDGVDAMVIEPGVPASLAAAMTALLDDRPLRARLGENARLKAEREYALDGSWIDPLLDAYDSLLREDAPSEASPDSRSPRGGRPLPRPGPDAPT